MSHHTDTNDTPHVDIFDSDHKTEYEHKFGHDTDRMNEPPQHPLQQSSDLLYHYYPQSIKKLRDTAPYTTDSKYFRSIQISTLATMKMLKHALLGVERGRADNGIPQEIMGLLIGKPHGNCIIILDVAPLPVVGTETRVVADDAQMHMIGLMESLELRRKDTFIGWYHSHPFDLESYSHCHLSNTDVLTQQNWQRVCTYKILLYNVSQDLLTLSRYNCCIIGRQVRCG